MSHFPRFSWKSVVAYRRLSCRFVQTSAHLRYNENQQDSQMNFDTLGTWDNRIDLPILLQQSIKHGIPVPKISSEHSGCASIAGRRATNEDRYKVTELLPSLLYFAVFDGHGGPACADFCNNNLEQHILFWLSQGERDLQAILQTSFLELNNAFARYVVFNNPGDATNSGTTATVCLLRNSNELVVAHVGDSRAILCRDGEPRKLTIDHVPDLKSEKERIIKSGGGVQTDSLGRGLVNGRLAMTRSIGDLDLKPYGVIPIPDTRSIEVKHGRDAFVILTSDGINFVMNDQEICNAVNNSPDPKEAVHLVTDQAMQFASEDNATAVVVPFGAWGKYMLQGNISYNFLRNLSQSTKH